MTTPTLAPPSVDNGKRNVCLYMAGTAAFAPTWDMEVKTDSATGIVTNLLHIHGMPVFRSGTFKDSMGDLNTWETVHIENMVSNFNFLRDNSVFPDVPVREGHGSFFGDPMTGLVGYHDALTTVSAAAPDGNTYLYLLADFTLTCEEDQQAFLSGKWRNRSAEVGYYESNDGTGYYPVYQGFAFVDIPAVQYLNMYGINKQRSFNILLEKEIEVTAPTPAPADPANPPADPNAPVNPPVNPPVDPVNPPADPTNPPANPDDPTPPAPPAQGAFALGGRVCSDPVEIQAYIAGLEISNANFAKAARESNLAQRKAYVSQLSSQNKIMAAQEVDLAEHVVTLSDDQFNSFKAMYDKSPVISLFQNHVANPGSNPDDTLSQDEKDFAGACDRVKHMRTGRLLDAQLVETSSYKEMVRLATKLGKETV